ITKSNYLLIFPIFMISAMSYAGVDITVGQMLFKSSPKKESTYYLSVFTSLTGLTSAFGPILGGLLAELIKSRAYVPALDMLPPLKYIFIISFLLRVSSIPMIYRLHDPKARDVDAVLHRMKALKYVSFFTNVYSFANYTSKIVLVPQKQLFILEKKAAESAFQFEKDTINSIGRGIKSLKNAIKFK
ncbi:hypothetical protein KY311_02735, partial [Candidatus Woesearchaeota archaeon]|nr:hypothetical protein [Candidatus Woesearchaeota archaeon]